MNAKHDAHVTPKVTVDIIIKVDDSIVLISRKNEPFGWALPGGFVDVGERCIEAAAREALEETGLVVKGLTQFHTYTDPARDERGHGISVVYYGFAKGHPVAADDAKSAILIKPDDIIANTGDLHMCFDHLNIIEDWWGFMEDGVRPTRE